MLGRKIRGIAERDVVIRVLTCLERLTAHLFAAVQPHGIHEDTTDRFLNRAAQVRILPREP